MIANFAANPTHHFKAVGLLAVCSGTSQIGFSGATNTSRGFGRSHRRTSGSRLPSGLRGCTSPPPWIIDGEQVTPLTIGTTQATLGRGSRASRSAKAAALSVLDCSECLQICFGGQQILTGFQSRGNRNASPPGGCSYRVTEC